MSKGPYPVTPFEVGTTFYTPWITTREDGSLTMRATSAAVVSGTPYDSIMRDVRTGEMFRMLGLHRFPVDLPDSLIDEPAAVVDAKHSHFTILSQITDWLVENAPEKWGMTYTGNEGHLVWEFAEEVDAVLFKLRWC